VRPSLYGRRRPTLRARGQRDVRRAPCGQARLLKDELEAAILVQIGEIHADIGLVGAALEEAAAR
jgi:hypothetical protein